MASGVTGDFGRLTGTIAALRALARVPSRVAGIAAPRIEQQIHADTNAGQDPYARAYAPHMPATVKRWGPHQLLNLNGDGIASLRASPMAGAGIALTAADHMNFTQAGTPTQQVRAVFPNNPSTPKSWNRILEKATIEAAEETMRVAK